MRLLTRYNRVNLIATVIVMLLAGIIYYNAVSHILTSQVDKDLVVEEQEIFEHVRQNHILPQVYGSVDQKITFSSIGKNSVKRRFLDTIFRNKGNDEEESGRGLVSSVLVNGTNYRINVTESKVETDDLIRIIFFITAVVILTLVLALFIINRLTIKRLWNPFYKILSQLRGFNIADKTEISTIKSDTEEFNELNAAIVAMARKAQNDYRELKTFTENASHELMTPIAVINSQMDTLLQTGSYNEAQSQVLSNMYESVARLTRLNRSMLLLVKIENNMLQDRQNIDLKPVIMMLVNQLRELYADRDIAVTTNLKDRTLHISKSLLEILLNNLLINAVKHNRNGGEVRIDLDSNKLTIANTGKEAAAPVGDIFKRFNKSDQSEGTGLGLTIAKQICENNGLKLNYLFDGTYHTFNITF